MRCPNCGTENQPGLRFCEQCGTPLAEAQLEAVQLCPRCRAHNRPGLRFCEQCAAPLATPPGGVIPPPRRRRWLLWAGAAAASILLLIIVAGVAALIFIKPARSDRDEAVRVADRIVEQAFPKYKGAERMVNTWEGQSGKTVYVVSYGLDADEAHGVPFPSSLFIYVDPETHQVSIEESD